MSALDDLRRFLGGGQYTDLGTPEALAPIPPRLVTGGALGPAGQPAGWSAPDYALQHIDDMLSGKVARQGVLGQNNYDPSQSFAQNALNPKAIEQATEIAGGIGPGAIRAYHGSPYFFDRFDLSKIGTGEGAQTYGHGLYFAELEDVARGYRDSVTQKLGVGMGPANEWLARAGGDPARALAMFDEFASGLPSTPAQAQVRAALETATRPGHMYEVDIHADPKAFLAWDKPVGEQSAEVQEILRPGLAPYMTMQPMGTVVRQAGESPYAAELLFGRKAALTPGDVSERLRELGIPGSRYLDQGSRGAGEGSSNYAIFDPKIIEILRKYGILPPIAAGGGLLATGSEPPT